MSTNKQNNRNKIDKTHWSCRLYILLKFNLWIPPFAFVIDFIWLDDFGNTKQLSYIILLLYTTYGFLVVMSSSTSKYHRITPKQFKKGLPELYGNFPINWQEKQISTKDIKNFLWDFYEGHKDDSIDFIRIDKKEHRKAYDMFKEHYNSSGDFIKAI